MLETLYTSTIIPRLHAAVSSLDFTTVGMWIGEIPTLEGHREILEEAVLSQFGALVRKWRPDSKKQDLKQLFGYWSQVFSGDVWGKFVGRVIVARVLHIFEASVTVNPANQQVDAIKG